jgi:hypothetical protein
METVITPEKPKDPRGGPGRNQGRKPTGNALKGTSISLPPPLLASLRAEALARGISLSALIVEKLQHKI